MPIIDQQFPKNIINNSRFSLEYFSNSEVTKDDGQDVINSLTKKQKTLPPRYFYDAKGSQLFEDICQLSEYYPTRTEASILKQYANDITKVTGKVELIELGSGSSTKTRFLLDAYQTLDYPLTYIPIDVSGSILKESANSLLTDYPTLNIQGKVGTYQQCLTNIKATDKQPKMVLFLGSTIGNFNHQECDRFIDLVTDSLNSGDYFLLGIDLQKPQEILEAAYNDIQGVTAAFNLNMLQHLNWKFQGNFDINLFKHQAIYNNQEHQIEMYLISNQAHTATLQILDLAIDFAEGETIRTEISRKFNIEQMTKYLANKELVLRHSYTDTKQWFGLLLCQKR
ncbi:Histidine N-alpha-methyltransferase [Hyella patelloides LEGE 07179]|uniref:Histidine N-alpha-methyltransferase n=1 Tax=Hyella patelloides LEGE 07179 TaxID=945734 RepID=A0A563VVM8_9CYAN|nr:L-histidine N(alpha)-methyltransferase [Hyella patelloides]VEP15460.1 Histidine N-alpha-methyltransferase [Hyella patelloides LEGE 07179]